MQAILINPESRNMERVEIGKREEIAGLIGFDTIAADGGNSLRDAATDIDSLRGRIKYL